MSIKLLKPNLRIFPYLLVLFEVMIYLSNDMYIPALQQIMQNFNISSHMAQLTLTSWFLGGMSLQFVLGPLSDCYGRRPIALLGGLIYVLFTLICALSPNIHTLLISRFIEGSSQGFVLVAGYAAIHELFDTRRAIILISIMGSIVVLAPAFGPLLGSFVLQLGGTWRTIFLVLTISSLLLLLLLYRFMPESNKNIATSSLKLRATIQSYISILKTPLFILNTLIFCTLFGVFIVWLTGGPIAIILQLDRGATAFGWSQVFIFGGFIAGTRMVSQFIKFFDIQRTVNTGLMIAILGGILACIFTTLNPTTLYGMVFGLIIFSFGSSLAFGTLNRLAMESSHEAMGAKMAVFSTFMTGFGAFWSAVVSGLAINTLPMMAKLILLQVAVGCFLKWMSYQIKIP